MESNLNINNNLELLKKLISFPSINPPGNEAEISDFIYEFMTNAGIETIRIPAEENRINIVSKIVGKSSKNGIIFTGHMDVVPVSEEEKSRWTSDPFIPLQKDDFLFGRGACDMKSGLAAAMIAMVNLVKSGTVPERDIYLVATIDEEDSMKGSKALWNHQFISNANEVIVCEPTDFKVCTASRGRTYGTITVKGHTGHGSHFNEENNAILIANRIINEMRNTSFSEYSHSIYGESFWQPLAICAGVEPCVVPDICTIKIDARLTPGHLPDQIWTELDRIIADIYDKYSNIEINYEIIDKREPWIINSDSPLLKNIKKAYAEMSTPFKTDYFMGTTDGTILRRANRDVLIVGPGDLKYAHSENECVSISEYEMAIELYSKLMQ